MIYRYGREKNDLPLSGHRIIHLIKTSPRVGKFVFVKV